MIQFLDPIFISWEFGKGKGKVRVGGPQERCQKGKWPPSEPQTLGFLEQRMHQQAKAPAGMTEEASGGRAGSCDAGNVTPRKGPRWLEKLKHFSPTDGTGWIAGKGRWPSSNHRRWGDCLKTTVKGGFSLKSVA